MTISEALEKGAKILRDSSITEFRRETKSLLMFSLQKDGAFLIAHPETQLTANEIGKFEQYLNRRSLREPFQYIVGRQEFYGLDFEVSPDVLIPRPETEILVERAINILSGLESPRFCEVGVGSGCISISILHKVASARAIGTDISKGAIAVANTNARRHNVEGRFELRETSIFDGLDGQFDLIVSNPPYIPAAEIDSLQAEVRDHEPHSALDGGADGLAIIERIINQSPKLLLSSGILLLEIGFGQAEKVRTFFDRGIWKESVFLPDLQGIPRIVEAELCLDRNRP